MKPKSARNEAETKPNCQHDSVKEKQLFSGVIQSVWTFERTLKTKRRNIESPQPTDVDEVALAVQHDVAVVSVFDLQQKQQEAVGGHAADEIITSLQKGDKHANELKLCLFTPIF